MSLYADYLKERTTDFILETDEGFATYRYLSENKVYIIDLYVAPPYRKLGHAAHLADRICALAKSKGCTKLIGTVLISANGSNDSVKVLLAYGMTIISGHDGVIIFEKEI